MIPALILGRGTVETGAGLEVDMAQSCLLDEWGKYLVPM